MEGEDVTNVDSQGFSFKLRRFFNDAGELWTSPPGFSGVRKIIENLEQLKLRQNEVILTTYPKAGRYQALFVLWCSWFGHFKHALNSYCTILCPIPPTLVVLFDSQNSFVSSTST